MATTQQQYVARLEREILKIITNRGGTISFQDLATAMRGAGIEDEVFIKAAIWHLISQAFIERDADTLSLRQNLQRAAG